MSRRARAFALGLAVYGFVVGFLGGQLVERLLFDRQRTFVLTRVAAAEKRLHERLMDIERSGRVGPPLSGR